MDLSTIRNLDHSELKSIQVDKSSPYCTRVIKRSEVKEGDAFRILLKGVDGRTVGSPVPKSPDRVSLKGL